ncbi:Uncharacterised protein [Shigella sonnei]|nr:Uncharacterised protein [Shigella sonnei]
MRHRAAEVWYRADQRLGIRMMWHRHQLLTRRGFHCLTAVKHVNFIRPLAKHL